MPDKKRYAVLPTSLPSTPATHVYAIGGPAQYPIASRSPPPPSNRRLNRKISLNQLVSMLYLKSCDWTRMTVSTGAGDASASGAAYRHLRAQILDGHLAGGVMISEASVADELGMSRTPVREAFLRLQVEGWLRLYPKRGALVVEVHPHEREEIIQARLLIESDAVDRISVTSQGQPELSMRLQEILALQAAAAAHEDLNAFALLDADFHSAIVEAGENRFLSEFFSSLSDRQRRMTARSLWRRAERFDLVVAEHTELTQLIGMADTEGFRAALESHIRGIHRELLP